MPIHIVISNPVTQVQPEFFAPNDATPSPTGMHKVASAMNYVSCRQKKVIMVRAQDHNSNPASSSLASTAWPHYWRTGENTSGVVARVGVVLADSTGTNSTLEYTVRTFSTGDSSDTLVETVSSSNEGIISAGAITPSQVIRRTFVVRGLSPNTEYHGVFELNNDMRMVFASVHEAWNMLADDSVTGVCNPDKFHAEGPIYDEHANDLNEANNRLWRHNGAPYIGWSSDYARSSAPTTTSASFANLISNSAGFDIDATYHVTRRRTTVPVKMGVRAHYLTSASNAEFRLTDGTNNIDITGVTLPAVGSSRWFTTTSTIPASSANWRMQARRTSGSGSVAVDGWALFPYET